MWLESSVVGVECGWRLVWSESSGRSLVWLEASVVGILCGWSRVWLEASVVGV